MVQFSAQNGRGGTLRSISIQPIPTRCRCEQIFMLHDLPDFHADGSGDFFEIRWLVCDDRNAVTATGHEQPNQAKIEARHYIKELLAANQMLASHGENRGSSPLGSATGETSRRCLPKTMQLAASRQAGTANRP